ncbi:MAG: translational GTPase TypA [Waddliaceae bacterium]
MKSYPPEKIRNVAIIAHVDHGKTTLLDGLLKQSNVYRDNQVVPDRVMDSYDQEQERGITIFSKHTSIVYGDYKINLIDTPGHADFSGEVERILGMVNSVILIIDAQEGPMPQTRFVLSKSLKMGLKPLVIVNKIDRPHADPDRVLNETFDLFVELGATDEQLDFKHAYASALKGYAQLELSDPKDDLRPLLTMIINHVEAPLGNREKPFLIQAGAISYDDYLGRQLVGRILDGKVSKGTQVVHLDRNGKESKCTITKVEGHLGLQKIEMEEAAAGDIVCLSGIPEVTIGDSLCDPKAVVKLPPIELEEPTVSIDILVNDGPFVGQSGKHVTMNKIRDRLLREQRANISYQITEGENSVTVAGRGELHLSVLLEAMRREGYEFCVSKPKVILKQIDDKKCEPVSRVSIDVPEQFSGAIIDQLSRRKGEMQLLHTNSEGMTELEFLVPTRGVMGYRNEFLTSTKGLGILTYAFDAYAPWKGEISGRQRGVLISMNKGKANAYASFNIESRGKLFTAPGDEIYEGMVVGEHSRENDMIVNLTKGKQLTNVRASGTDENVVLTPPEKFTLEKAIGYIESDELIEVTPESIRLRKQYLLENDRKRLGRK